MTLLHSSFSVCVYCGARPGARPEYAVAGEAFGRALARRGWRLVYGAGDVGIMGLVARAALAEGGDTFGVVPEHLVPVEKARGDLGRVVVTETMHERKKIMLTNADAVVLLPGGAGSLDEFFEVLTWQHLGLHRKPILLLDVADYWQPLDALIRHMVAEGFADPPLLQRYRMVADVEDLIAALAAAAHGAAPVAAS